MVKLFKYGQDISFETEEKFMDFCQDYFYKNTDYYTTQHMEVPLFIKLCLNLWKKYDNKKTAIELYNSNKK